MNVDFRLVAVWKVSGLSSLPYVTIALETIFHTQLITRPIKPSAERHMEVDRN